MKSKEGSVTSRRRRSVGQRRASKSIRNSEKNAPHVFRTVSPSNRYDIPLAVYGEGVEPNAIKGQLA